MLRDLKELFGYQLSAKDGVIGHVKDFYFDDKSWSIRYLVVDTGPWLIGRQVLLSPHSLRDLNDYAKSLSVKLTRTQIEDGPSIESHVPVSRQYEEAYFNHYGWPAYWEDGEMWGVAGFPVAPVPSKNDDAHHHGHNQRDDIHLRSVKAVTGYHVHLRDGSLGLVSGLMIEAGNWVICHLAVSTGHWYANKIVFIAASNVERISRETSELFVNLTKADLQQAPAGGLA